MATVYTTKTKQESCILVVSVEEITNDYKDCEVTKRWCLKVKRKVNLWLCMRDLYTNIAFLVLKFILYPYRDLPMWSRDIELIFLIKRVTEELKLFWFNLAKGNMVVSNPVEKSLSTVSFFELCSVWQWMFSWGGGRGRRIRRVSKGLFNCIGINILVAFPKVVYFSEMFLDMIWPCRANRVKQYTVITNPAEFRYFLADLFIPFGTMSPIPANSLSLSPFNKITTISLPAVISHVRIARCWL